MLISTNETNSYFFFFYREFKGESLALLNHCYVQNDAGTLRLLTAELPNWGHHTCLSLAVIANHRRFLAHPW